MEKTSHELIREIHWSFDSAADSILKESLTVIEKIKEGEKEDFDKIKKLKDKGFPQCGNVTNVRELNERRQQLSEMTKIVEFWSVNYPQYKFVTDEQVKNICKKYGLVNVVSHRFKGEIPMKNVDEILNFEIKTIHKSFITMSSDMLNLTQVPDSSIISYDTLVQDSVEFEADCQQRIDGIDSAIKIQKNESELVRLRMSRDKYTTAKYKLKQIVQNNLPSEYEEMWKNSAFLVCVSYKHSYPRIEVPFTICAPESDFQLMSNERFADGKIVLDDPIVLYKVKGGSLVVSKWGLEGEDSELVNQQMN